MSRQLETASKIQRQVKRRPCKKATPEIETETTYSSSYMKLDGPPRPRISYEPRTAGKTGKFCFETMHKLSYQPSTGIVREPFVPRPQLSINGSHDMVTVYETSYSNPGYVKTASYKPCAKKIPCSRPMNCNSVMKQSYKKLDALGARRAQRCGFWRTKFKTDYRTTSQMSYQHVEPVSKGIRLLCRPIISAPLQRDTVYSTSYRTPVSKKNCNR
ncbi:uncharacterized protein LOC143431862 [Xylocopa sonorina]|uniref:uncharacterized protein LOC143431862 n=1 Tax=Xylocopa sonorina TaxID=1818115 RepID=UPI00403A9391